MSMDLAAFAADLAAHIRSYNSDKLWVFPPKSSDPDPMIAFFTDLAADHGLDIEIAWNGDPTAVRLRDPASAPSWDRALYFRRRPGR